MSKFKVGDIVKFIPEEDGLFEVAAENNTDPSESYKVVKVYTDEDNHTTVDIGVSEGAKDWDEDWFELDKSTIVHNLLKDL